MKKTIIVFCFLVITYLTSCSTAKQTTSYVVALQYADRGVREVSRNIKIVENANDVVETSYLYEDELLSILWNVEKDIFAFALENKSGNTLEIPWDEIVYIDRKKDEQRVIHKNVKYVNRNLPQTPTIVPKDSTVAEYLFPVRIKAIWWGRQLKLNFLWLLMEPKKSICLLFK